MAIKPIERPASHGLEIVPEELRALRKSARVEERLAGYGAPLSIIKHALAVIEKRSAKRYKLPAEMCVRKGETAVQYVERMKRDYPTLAKDLNVRDYEARPANERRANETEDAYNKRRAQKIREEIFRTATRFRVINKRTRQLTTWEDPDCTFEPVFEDEDERNRRRAAEIEKLVRQDEATLDAMKREEDAAAEDRLKNSGGFKASHVRAGGAY